MIEYSWEIFSTHKHGGWNGGLLTNSICLENSHVPWDKKMNRFISLPSRPTTIDSPLNTHNWVLSSMVVYHMVSSRLNIIIIVIIWLAILTFITSTDTYYIKFLVIAMIGFACGLADCGISNQTYFIELHVYPFVHVIQNKRKSYHRHHIYMIYIYLHLYRSCVNSFVKFDFTSSMLFLGDNTKCFNDRSMIFILVHRLQVKTLRDFTVLFACYYFLHHTGSKI